LKNLLISLNVGFQGRLLTNDLDCIEYVRYALSNYREGFLKLEYSSNLTPSEVFLIYRRRDTFEKLMDSPKNHIHLKLLCVWSNKSVKGTLLLCFLDQVIVSMVRYEMPEPRKRSTKFIIGSPSEFDSHTHLRQEAGDKVHILEF